MGDSMALAPCLFHEAPQVGMRNNSTGRHKHYSTMPGSKLFAEHLGIHVWTLPLLGALQVGVPVPVGVCHQDSVCGFPHHGSLPLALQVGIHVRCQAPNGFGPRALALAAAAATPRLVLQPLARRILALLHAPALDPQLFVLAGPAARRGAPALGTRPHLQQDTRAPGGCIPYGTAGIIKRRPQELG